MPPSIPASALQAPASSPTSQVPYPDPARVNLRWALALLDGLIAGGVEHLVLSPGSRSTPVVLAGQRRPDLTLTPILDERSAAFFALGLARASGRPVALLATSGSAPAHWYPAVMEANEAGIPLILLSADRPPELRGWGANQTTDQTRLFGVQVRDFFDPGAPVDDPGIRRAVTALGYRAAARSQGRQPGPVHINLPFREPLVPRGECGPDSDQLLSLSPSQPLSPPTDAINLPPAASGAEDEYTDQMPGPEPKTRYIPPGAHSLGQAACERGQLALDGTATIPGPPASQRMLTAANQLRSILASLPPGLGARLRGRGLIYCGPDNPRPGFRAAVLRCAAALGVPVLADPLSELRFGQTVENDGGQATRTDCANHHEAAGHAPDNERLARDFHANARQTDFVRAARTDPGHAAKTHFSHVACTDSTSSPLISRYKSLIRNPAAARALRPDWVLRFGRAPISRTVLEWLPRIPLLLVDPAGRWSDPAHDLALPDSLHLELDPVALCAALAAAPPAPADPEWLALWTRAEARLTSLTTDYLAQVPWCEAHLITDLVDRLPAGEGLLCANSLPIRQFETWSGTRSAPLTVFGNRGLSGIDGQLSTLAGLNAAGPPTTGLLGDLSFLHDLSGLILARDLPRPCILINNGGGRIFDYLPQHGLPDFERLWRTPQSVDLGALCQAFGLRHRRVSDAASWRAALAEGLTGKRGLIIEVLIDADQSREVHLQFRRRVAEAELLSTESRY